MTLELRRLGRRFGEFALRDISLRLEPGQYCVLLGPSGCGKSVLLQTIAGFHAPDSGQVLLSGRDATREPPEKRGLGVVFQQAALFEHMSVQDNIGYAPRVRRLPVAERARRVASMVELLQLGPVLGRPVATLSGGEAQRVAIARALAVSPRLLLLDEPLSMLDHNTRLELRERLASIHRELGTTTLHVTHSREEARALGDRLAVMVGGCVVQCGTSDEVFSRPACPFVASFLGSTAPAANAEAGEPRCSAGCPARPACDLGPPPAAACGRPPATGTGPEGK